MEYLYIAVWAIAVLSVLWSLFGLPFWLVLAAVTYFASRRSRVLAETADAGRSGVGPDVTRYARASKVTALILAGTMCLIAASAGALVATRAVGVAGAILNSVAASLSAALPGMSVALAVLLMAAIGDIWVGRRVAGRDTAVAIWIATSAQAALLVLVLVSDAAGVQML